MTQKYHDLIKSMYQNTDAGDKIKELSVEQYVSLFGKGKDCRDRMRRFYKDIFSGNVYVSREFLILFAFYAGYNKEQLNNALRKSDFEELKQKNRLDNIIIEYLNMNYVTELRRIINTKNFVRRKLESTDINNMRYAVGEYERKEFKNWTDEFHETFAFMLSTYDNEFLNNFFASKRTKHLIEASDELLSSITNNLEENTTSILRG